VKLLEFAQQNASNTDNPIVLLVCLGLFSLMPILLMGTTSFIKISVVLSIFRNALGAGQLPSAAVSGLLSLALSLHIMTPVIQETLQQGKVLGSKHLSASAPLDSILKLPPKQLQELAEGILKPLETFLLKHSNLREREFFAAAHLTDDEKQNVPCGIDSQCKPQGESLLTLIPAFVLSELQAAFAIGFSIFLPFLVIDLVIANLLVGMGMVMVSPVTISLPFKVLLFVSCDGWFLLCTGLINSYGS